MMNEEMQHKHEHHHGCGVKCISWSAIFTGALVGIGLSVLLNLFSIAIGLSIYSVKEGITTLAIGGLIGVLIGLIVANFVSGFTAGYLARPYCAKRHLGVLYGFTAWCVMLVLTVFLAAHVGRYIAAYTSFVANPTTVVKVTRYEAAPAVSASMGTTTQTVSVNPEKAVDALGTGAFIIFGLFFISALSSCFGGHFGMGCRESSCKHD